MKFPRRQFLHLAAGAAALPAVSRIASAQTYPTKPVHLIVGYAAGGSPDIVARLIGQWLSERLDQQFIIENRTGANGNIATEMAVRAIPDGYTVLMSTVSNATNASMYEKLNFNFIRDIAPVVGLMRVPDVMVVSPSFPAKTVPEFIAYARANPGKINFASSGIGSTIHLCGELFKVMTGINMTHVPYRGGAPAALTDILSGQVHVMFDNMPNSIQHIRAGTLRALAVTTATRWAGLPDTPTVAEFVPGYDVKVWYGIGVPRNTPVAIIDKLNKQINAALADPKFKARLADLSGTVIPGSPADFGELIAAETERWATVIKFAGIKAD
jgi:tripartite-type tricarboxylate transporter receptor subunit TctC